MVEKTLLVTRIKTIKHVAVTIPNSPVMSARIINYSTSADAGKGVILHTTATTGYDVPWQEAQKSPIEAALATRNCCIKGACDKIAGGMVGGDDMMKKAMY